ncbi:MAG: Bcr/CflA family efflux MFS transporter, partial [Gammaproteobacteria bacterium]
MNKNFLAFIVFLILPLSGLAIDIYVPSLPAVSHYFGAEKALVQLTISAYMLGMGVMQLFAGGISDSFGRRQPFLIAMCLFIIATFSIPFAQTINQLIVLRLVQGMLVAIIAVPMRAVVSDLFQGPAYYKMANYMTMAWSIGPIIAPAIGGYLQHYFDWQANFYFLGIYCLLSFTLIAFYLPETSIHRHPFHLMQILARYKQILQNKDFLIGLMINGILYSMIILFSIVGPFLIQTVLHYSAVEFGHVALLTGLAWFVGTMINRFIIHLPLQKKVGISLLVMFLVAVISMLINIFMPMTIYSVVVPILIILLVGGIIFPNYFARSMALFPKTTGSANALFGAFVFLIPSVSSGLGTLLKSTSAVPLTMTYVGLIGLCL